MFLRIFIMLSTIGLIGCNFLTKNHESSKKDGLSAKIISIKPSTPNTIEIVYELSHNRPTDFWQLGTLEPVIVRVWNSYWHFSQELPPQMIRIEQNFLAKTANFSRDTLYCELPKEAKYISVALGTSGLVTKKNKTIKQF